jgi:uncharacterized protein (DUF2062 family)
MHEEFQRQRLSLLRRKRWLRRLLRPLPRRANIRRYPVIKWFAETAGRLPFLWSFKRSSVAPALYFGTVLAVLPLYGIQFALAFAAAILFRANVTVLFGLQLITNPLTLGPIYYVTYKIGMWLIATTGFGEGAVGWGTRINALFVGGIVLGLAIAVVIDLLWLLIAWEARVFRARFERLRHETEAVSKSDSHP